MSFLLKGGKGREASRRRALLQPMSVVECVADIVPGRDVSRIVSLRAMRPLQGLMASPVKQTLAMFLAEVLGLVLRSGQPDAPTFDFVAQSVAVLDELPAGRASNFHLAFLRGLHRARPLGLPPRNGFRHGRRHLAPQRPAPCPMDRKRRRESGGSLMPHDLRQHASLRARPPGAQRRARPDAPLLFAPPHKARRTSLPRNTPGAVG